MPKRTSIVYNSVERVFGKLVVRRGVSVLLAGANMTRTTIIQSIFLFAALSTVLSAQERHARSLADQPADQQAAVREILKLGGDWEAPSKTVLIGLIGDKFTKETFRLLTPLVDLRMLLISEVPVDDSALEPCSKLENVRQLGIQRCRFTGVGLKNFAECKHLERLIIEETPVTDEGLGEIARLKNLRTIDILNNDVPSKITEVGVRKLTSLKQLKYLWITMADVPDHLEAEIEKLLPECHVSLNQYRPIDCGR